MTQKNHLSYTIEKTRSIWLYFYFCSPLIKEQALPLIPLESPAVGRCPEQMFVA